MPNIPTGEVWLYERTTTAEYFRSAVPKLSLTIYHFSISIDEHVPLKFLMTTRLRKITKIYLPISI